MEEVKSKSGNLSTSRREFIERAGMTAVITTFGLSFFTACSDPEEPNAPNVPPPTGSNGVTISGNTIRIDLTSQTRLAAAGGWLLVLDAQTLVVNVEGTYRALTSVCTHSACDRNWTFTNSKFICSCHGSEFDTSGNVLKSPANQPLRSFTTALNGTVLTVTK
jgi:cytochrome b6-f complex iron-sulfur subunit